MSIKSIPKTSAMRRQVLNGLGAVSLSSAFPIAVMAQPKAVNAGVILPFSGGNTPFGISSRQGIELVAEEIHASCV